MRKWKFKDGQMVELSLQEIKESEPHLWELFEMEKELQKPRRLRAADGRLG